MRRQQAASKLFLNPVLLHNDKVHTTMVNQDDPLMMDMDVDPVMLMMAEKGDDVLSEQVAVQQQQPEQQQQQQQPGLMGRAPVCLYLSCNAVTLSEYQCLVRKQIELFEAMACDVESNAKGRNKPIVLGQVGIRCTHCSCVPPAERESGAMYYPTTLEGIYQAAQILANGHLLEKCKHIPQEMREELCRLKSLKNLATAGKQYWAEGANALGVYEASDGCLRFTPRIGMREYK